jgi:methyltransferase-like protein
LQQVSDADVTRLFGPREPAEVRGFLDGLPPLPRQQYVDFLTNCTSRSALVCHRDVQIRSRPDECVLRDCWISLATAPRGDQVVPDPRIREALSCLEKRRPESVAFNDLTDGGPSSTGVFMEAYAAGLIEVALAPARVSGRISDCPMVSPLVRLQAEDGAIVTNQRCEAVRLTGLARHVVMLLDGAHSREAVVESVAREMLSGGVASDWILRLADDEPDAERVAANILRHLRDHALLVG